MDSALFRVIPPNAGIQSFHALLDSRFRGSDEELKFFRILLMATQPLIRVMLSDKINWVEI